jgi:hypothetical protein
MNVVLGHLLVLLPEPRRLIALRQPKQNPAGGAPRRGDCGPDAEGRVHLLPGPTSVILSPNHRPVGPIRDSGTRNLWSCLMSAQGSPPS